MSVIEEKERPLVSVGILTYNHEKYIAEAIESVLRQKVNFKYEIVIAEDCSTDNTRNIVIEYQKNIQILSGSFCSHIIWGYKKTLIF